MERLLCNINASNWKLEGRQRSATPALGFELFLKDMMCHGAEFHEAVVEAESEGSDLARSGDVDRSWLSGDKHWGNAAEKAKTQREEEVGEVQAKAVVEAESEGIDLARSGDVDRSWLSGDKHWGNAAEKAKTQREEEVGEVQAIGFGLMKTKEDIFMLSAPEDVGVNENKIEEDLGFGEQGTEFQTKKNLKVQLGEGANDAVFYGQGDREGDGLAGGSQRVWDAQSVFEHLKSDYVMPPDIRREVEPLLSNHLPTYSEEALRKTNIISSDILALSDVVIKKTKTISAIPDTTITFAVRDERLGLIRVTLVQKKGAILGELACSVGEVVDKLQKQLPNLLGGLKEQGIVVKSLRVCNAEESHENLQNGFSEEKGKGKQRRGWWHVGRYIKEFGEQRIDCII